MRKLFYLFALVSLVLFVMAAINFSHQFQSGGGIKLANFKGFEDTNPNTDYTRLTGKFEQKIRDYNTTADHDQNTYFWLSFLVTALTAGSTLVSSIQAAKKDPAGTPAGSNTRLFAIILAVLTFSSSLANFTSTHFNDLKTEAFKKVADLNTMRGQFFAAYDKAFADTKPSVITEYESQLGTY